MFKKLFGRKGRFQNSWMIIFSVALIIMALCETINPTSSDNIASIFSNIKVVFGLPIVILGAIGLISTITILILEHKKVEYANLPTIKKIIYYVLFVLVLIYFVEYVILGIVRSFILASSYEKIPEKELFFVSTAWLLMNNGKDYLNGILVTLSISLLGTIIGLIFGLLLAMIRVQKVSDKDSEVKAFFKKLGLYFSKGYIGLFRGTPMMVQAILLYYLVPFAISQSTGIPMDTMNKIFTWFISGLITVSLNTTAYLAEVLRGGIESLDQGQTEAARSLGLSYWKTMLYVILPQALKNSMPSIGNEFVINIKDTSVLNVISVIDIYYVATMIKGQYFRFNEPFFIAACIYLILTFVTTRILSFIDKKMEIDEKPLPSCN